jgi:hypothetical protein
MLGCVRLPLINMMRWSGCSISYLTREIVLSRPSEWPKNQGVVWFLHPVLGAVCLLACYCAETHQHCSVHGTRIIQDASYDPLDMLNVGIREGWGSIYGQWPLHFATILLWLWSIWAMLWFGWDCMFVLLELFDDISWHQNIQTMVIVIPI